MLPRAGGPVGDDRAGITELEQRVNGFFSAGLPACMLPTAADVLHAIGTSLRDDNMAQPSATTQPVADASASERLCARLFLPKDTRNRSPSLYQMSTPGAAASRHAPVLNVAAAPLEHGSPACRTPHSAVATDTHPRQRTPSHSKPCKMLRPLLGRLQSLESVRADDLQRAGANGVEMIRSRAMSPSKIRLVKWLTAAAANTWQPGRPKSRRRAQAGQETGSVGRVAT